VTVVFLWWWTLSLRRVSCQAGRRKNDRNAGAGGPLRLFLGRLRVRWVWLRWQWWCWLGWRVIL